MKRITKGGLAVLGVMSMAAFAIQPANADIQAQSNDIVGVGSDTVQYVADFVVDGTLTAAGSNVANPARRVFNFDASADYYGRGSYSRTSTPTVPVASVPGAGLREQQKPVNRPNGSGAGITAINNDNGATEVINYARSSRLPTCAENTTSVTNGKGGLHVVQIATDELEVGTAATTNAPAGLTPLQLANIYDGTWTTWGQVNGTSDATLIHPFIPQSGSGTRNFFLADLLAAKPGFTLLSSIPQSEEHDPTPLIGDPNAIAPFSKGRLTLLNSGYFSNSGYVANSVVLLSGAGTYDVTRGLYIIVRQNDWTATTPAFQVGGTLTWAQSLFGAGGNAGTAAFTRSSAAARYTAAGVVQTPAASTDLGAPGVAGTTCTT
jgi:ABC-type phosphate transport system substrate-binding protein